MTSNAGPERRRTFDAPYGQMSTSASKFVSAKTLNFKGVPH